MTEGSPLRHGHLRRWRLIARNTRGATTVELAFVLPILILFIYGLFIIGTIFEANAGMQHALGEGARYATLYPTPDNGAIATRMSSKVYATSNGTFTAAVSSGSVTGLCNAQTTANHKTLTVSYTMPVNFLFFTAPNLSISRCKTVYIAS